MVHGNVICICLCCSIVRELIRMKKGIMDSEDDESNTPLHKACLRGHVDTAKVLLEAGADPNARSVNDCQI